MIIIDVSFFIFIGSKSTIKGVFLNASNAGFYYIITNCVYSNYFLNYITYINNV